MGKCENVGYGRRGNIRCVLGAWGFVVCLMKSEKREKLHMLPFDVNPAVR